VWLAVGLVFAVVRLPFLGILFALFLAFDSVANKLSVTILKRLIKVTLVAITARLILLCMGFWWISSNNVYLKRKDSESSSVRAGNLILVNKTSYVESLYLAYAFAPMLANPQNYWNDESEETKTSAVRLESSFLDGFKTYNSDYKYPKNSKGISLKEALKEAELNSRSPVAIAPEGAITNGSGLLQFLPVFQGLNISSNRIHLVTFSYDTSYFSPVFPVGKFWIHFLQLILQPSNKLVVKRLPEADVPVLGDASNSESVEAWKDQIGKYMAAMLKVRSNKLTSLDKHAFLDYWRETQKKNYVKTS